MSAASTRRALLRAIAAGALLPAFARTAAAQAGGRPIAPPPHPMIFHRKLRRGLSSGYAVIAEREFEIRFAPQAGGYRIEGSQIASSVEAPPNLEVYARLERERREDGLFPLLLDESGLIRSGPEGAANPNLGRALDLALEELTAGLETQDERSEARNFILGLQQAAGTLASAMPVDLFVPPATPQQASRQLTLPGGLSGAVSTEYSGRTSPDTGLLVEAKRIIVTDTGGSRRETVETWTLRAGG